MKHFTILAIAATFICALFTISCGTRHYASSDFTGIFDSGNFMGTFKGCGTIPLDTESIAKTPEEIVAFYKGDSGTYLYPYVIYHKLPSDRIIIASYGFNIFGEDAFYGTGQWKIINNDTVMLEFRSFAKPSEFPVYGQFGGLVYEGKRYLKILNKNELLFEYKPFHAKNGEKIRIIYKRLKE